MNDLHKFKIMVMDFLVKLRNENTFDDTLYNEICKILKEMAEVWTKQDSIPKSAFISCIYLTDFLAGGSRFLSEKDSLKVEDACNEVQELLSTLDK